MKNSYKKIISVVLTIIILLTAAPMSGFVGLKLNLDWLNFDWLDFSTKSSALDATGQCGDNVYWTFDESTGTLTISGTGNMKNYSSSSSNCSPFYNTSSIKTVIIESGVTSIGSFAFRGCTGLTSVTISGSVTSIGQLGFCGCTGLTSITIPDSVKYIDMSSFAGCTGLTSVTIPDGLTRIYASVFASCTGLTSVTIPESVEGIGENAFYGCTNLTTVNYYAVNGSISRSAFLECPNITTLNVGDNVISIPNCAFYEFTGLTSLTIPDSVTSIGGGAFYGCTGLTSITIPDSVTSIGESAFNGCTGLTSITIPDSVTSIGSFAFGGVLNVNYNGTASGFPWGARTVNGYVEYPLAYSDLTKTSLLACQSSYNGEIIIPDSVKSIGDNAFRYCDGLTSITIPDSVTSIGDSAFRGCTGLKELTIPCSVDFVYYYTDSSYTSSSYYENNTFYNCSNIEKITFTTGSDSGTIVTGTYTPWRQSRNNLKTVVIQDGITSIDSSAFSGCTELTSITIPDSVTSIRESAFYNTGYYNDSSNWENDVLYIGNHLIKAKSFVSGDYIIKSGTKCIADYSFSGCTGLTNITIPDSVSSIGWRAFYDCTGLASVTIPDSVTSIGDYAFYNCTGLTSATIGNSVTSIGNSAFYNCTGLTSATIPDSVTSIGSSAFGHCAGLTSVTIGDSVTSIGDSAFSNCTRLKSIIMGKSVTNIGKNVFSYDIFMFCRNDYSVNYAINNNYRYLLNYSPEGEESIVTETVTNKLSYILDKSTSTLTVNCDGVMPSFQSQDAPWLQYKQYIVNLVINEGCTKISYNAFKDLWMFNVDLPSTLTTIDSFAFSECIYLSDVSLPDGVTSINSNAFSGCKIQNLIIGDGLTSIPDTMINKGCLKKIIIGNGITSIGNSAFYNCTELSSVTIGNSVTSIGYYAFECCTGLTSIVIPDSVTSIGDEAFFNCTGLTSVTIGNSVTSIGYKTFYGCTGLTSVTIPDSVTSISDAAFMGCTGLTSIKMPNSVTSIGNSVFSECTGLTSVTIPNSVTSIGNYVFKDCTGLTSVTIGNSVTSIGTSAFSNCTGLVSVTIPDSVMSIGDYVFSGCTDLTSVTIGNSVASIGESAFNDCCGLISVNISSIESWCKILFSNYFSNPLYYAHNLYLNGELVTNLVISDSVTRIGDYAFEDCTGLTSITIGNSVTNIGDSAFSNCTGLTGITIPDSVTSIGSSAFYNCTGLASIVIPDSVTSIGSYAFYNCTGLASIVIPDSVTSIGNSAFYNCTGLASIVIPDSVTSIGNSAFSGCTGIEDIVIPISVQSIGESSFLNVKTIKFYNRNCTIGANAVSYIATIYGYAGSTAQAFADENGFDFVPLSEDHEHEYSYPCDTSCNICGYVREDITHTYSNPCDPDCDICGYIRTDLTHTFDNDCDDTCNFCGEKRTAPHKDENNDGICDVCGLSLSDITPGNAASIKVSAGETGYLKFIPTQKGIYRFYSTGSADTYGYICDSNKSAIASDDDSGNNNNFSVSATLTAGTVYYLGARYYSSSSSGTISVTLVCDQVICDHVTTHEEHQEPTCTVNGYTRVICDVCGQTVSETVYPASHHYAWVTIRNATTTEEGLAQKKCTVCGYVAEEFTIPVMVADFVTGITISPKTIALSAGDTADITALITPETAANKNIIWSSTDSENVTVSGGTVTAVRPGTSVIIAETEDGGYRDFCHVRVISLTASNGAVVNSESGLVYGLAPKLGSIDGYIDTVDDSISAVCEDSVIGTGSVIQIVRDGELIDSYEAVIFGDVNSDGVYDGQDAFIVNCIANGMLTREQVGEAKFLAADCNHDGEVNSSDVLILEQAGLLLSKVEQAKDEEMKEQTLGEYLDLIDQNPEKETDPTEEDSAIISIFKYVVNLIKKCFDYIISTFFPKV